MNIRTLTAQDFLKMIKEGNTERVKSWLLANNDKPEMINIYDLNGVPALNLAIINQQTEIALAIIGYNNADLNMTDRDGKSALLAAAEAGDMDVLEALLQKSNVKFNLQSNGFNALELAALQNREEIVRKLMEYNLPVQSDVLFKELKNKKLTDMAMLLVDYKTNQFDSLQIGALDINKEVRNTILKLSPENFQRLKTIIDNLKWMGLLNNENLSTALNRIQTSTKPAIECNEVITKEGDKQFTTRILNNGVSYFVFKGPAHLTSGQGLVKRGYRSLSSTHTDYAVKKLKPSNHGTSKMMQESVKHEVKYLRLAGRFAAWYQGGSNPVLITDWQNGKTVNEPLDLSDLPLLKRFALLNSFFTDLNKLHQQFRIHGDIKHKNVVIDLDEKSMKLIDFGSAKKIDSKKLTPWTREYLDPEVGAPMHASCDIYAAHLVIASLFPELFDLTTIKSRQIFNFNGGQQTTFMNKQHVFIKLTSNPTLEQIAVLTLIDAMRDRVQYRCTSEQALAYCQSILKVIDDKGNITEEQLAACLSSTLNRNYFTGEDALLNTKRPQKFGATQLENSGENRTVGEKHAEPVTSIFHESRNKKLKTDSTDKTAFTEPLTRRNC